MPFSQQVAFTGGVEEGGKIGRLKKVVCNLSAYLHSLGKDIVMPSRLLHIVSGSVSGWMAGLCQSHNPKHLKQTAAYLTPTTIPECQGWPPSMECSSYTSSAATNGVRIPRRLKHSTSSPHCKPEWKTHAPCSCTFSSCFLGHSAICWAIKIVTTDNLSAYEKLQLGKGLAAQRVGEVTHGVVYISWKCLP